jgi:hypothetical protein
MWTSTSHLQRGYFHQSGYNFDGDDYQDAVSYMSSGYYGSVVVVWGGDRYHHSSSDIACGWVDADYNIGKMFAVGDLNGNGRDDLIFSWSIGRLYPHEIEIYLDPTHRQPGSRLYPCISSFAMCIIIREIIADGDFNGDGYDDLVIPSDDGLLIHWGSSDLSGFDDADTIHVENGTAISTILFYCNINNDAFDDVVVRKYNGGNAYIYTGGQQIPNHFALNCPIQFPLQKWSIGMDLGDVNGYGLQRPLIPASSTTPPSCAVVSLAPLSSDQRNTRPCRQSDICNYPHPFRGGTTIQLQPAAASTGEVSIYNIRGQRVRTLARTAYTYRRTHPVLGRRRRPRPAMRGGVYCFGCKPAPGALRKSMLLLK